MRVAVVHPFSWPDVRRGGERYAHDLTGWLAGHGHQVDYLTGGPAHSIDVVDGVRMVRLHHRHGDRLTSRGITKLDSFGVTVAPWLLRHRYDVVHSFVPTAAIAARLARHRVVYTAIGHPIEIGRVRPADRRLFRAAVRAAHVTTVLSASAAAAASELTRRDVIVVPPGVRTDIFTPELRPRTGPIRLLFAAAAGEPRKRLPVLLAALPAVLAVQPDTRLIVGGGGGLPDGLDPKVRNAIDHAGAGDLHEMPQRYRDATVTVLPSVDEAFGLVLVESLACGTPVVASDSGGMAEIVTAEVGELVPPDDSAALANAILAVAASAAAPDTPRRCAEHAATWSWDSVGPRHLAAYDQARA